MLDIVPQSETLCVGVEGVRMSSSGNDRVKWYSGCQSVCRQLESQTECLTARQSDSRTVRKKSNTAGAGRRTDMHRGIM